MSVEAMTWAWKQTTGSVGHKAVLTALADRAGFYWECWPSQTRLATETEQSRRTVMRQLADLEQRGLIQRIHRYRPNSRGRTTDLILLLADQREQMPPNLADDLGVKLSPRNDVLGDNDVTFLVTPVSQLEPSVEPSVTSSPSWPTFDDFWSFYPLKRGKGEARTLWAKLSKTDRRDALEGARRHGRLIDDNPGVFVIPEAPPWLRKRRWEDDEPKRPPARGRPANDWAVELGPDFMAGWGSGQ